MPLGEQTVAVARPGAPRAPRSLVHVGLGGGGNLEAVHADFGVVDLHFVEARVHDIPWKVVMIKWSYRRERAKEKWSVQRETQTE